MNKPQVPTDPSDNAFKTIANVTATLSQGRSDAVAITGIVGLVLAFAFMTLTVGFVYTASHNPPPVNPPTQQSSPQKPN